VLYLSHYFKRQRTTYCDLLQSVRDEGDWEAWPTFFLRGMTEVSKEATDTARAMVDLRETHRDLIINEFGRAAGNALMVLEGLYSRPHVSVNQIADVTGGSYPAASSLMAKFVEHGLLVELRGHARNRWFGHTPYINIFARDKPSTIQAAQVV
jgi:Fic family protein